MWSLCLSLPAAGRREIVQLDGATATVQDLFRSAEEALSGSNDGQLVLKAGFPPVALDVESTQTLQEAGLSNQDKITVTIKEEEKAKSTAKKKTTTKATAKKASGGTTSKTAKQQQRKRPPKKQQAPESDSEHEQESEEGQTTSVASPSRPPRSRRAAAQKATESFAEVIQAQEEALQQQKKPATRKKPSNAAIRSPKKRPPAKFTATSAGRRLQDGAVVAARKRPRRSQPLIANGGDNSNDDPSLALLGTLESSSKAGRVLRKGWRKAVENTFEQNKAVARLAACEAGRVQFAVQGRNDNTASTMPQQLCVTFAKGVQGRGDFEETVDFLPRDVLQHVVASIHPTNPEALRPSNLALLSPRVLWSLAYHHCQQVNNEKATGESKTIPTNIAAALQALQPDLDWSFLRRRKQELSAKARENLRQQQEQETSASSVGEDWEAAAAAIASVEQAMEEVHVVDRSHRAAQALQAVERRQQEQEDEPSWQLETPNELDEDELLECVQECVPGHENDTVATNSGNAKEWVRRLIEGCGIHNWRELANVDNAEDLARQLSSSSSHDDNEEDADKKMPFVSAGDVQAWLHRARLESVDEIMVEVCDGNVTAVSLLMEHAQTATPRDLENWTSICDELHKVLVEATSSPNNDSNNKNGNGEDKNETHPPEVPSLVLLQKWCRQADMARDQIPWLAGMTSAI